MTELQTTLPEPLVSVVIASYSQPAMLLDAVESVRNQTYRPVEIIVVDDASRIDTLTGIRKLNDPGIRGITLDSNSGGPAVPMSVGARLARGKYIAFLDHDDQAKPNWLETLVHLLEGQANAGMAWGSQEVLAPSGDVREIDIRAPFGSGVLTGPTPQILLKYPSTTGLVIKNEIFQHLGEFDPGAGPYADLEFIMRFVVAEQWAAVRTDLVTVKHRKHASNMTADSVRMYRDLVYVVDKHEEDLAKWPAILGHFVYSLSYGSAMLGLHEESRNFYVRARRLLPSSVKLTVFGSIHKTRLFPLWIAMKKKQRGLASFVRIARSRRA